MKKGIMILTMGLFLGTIGYTSYATASEIQTERVEEDDKKKKKKCKKGDKKSCCADKSAKDGSSNENQANLENADKKSCDKKGEKKACCSKDKAASSENQTRVTDTDKKIAKPAAAVK